VGRWWCLWEVSHRCRVTFVLVVVIVPSFWSSKLLCAFQTSPSWSVFGRRRPLGLQRVVQLWWIQSLNDLRFFSSAKKDGTVVQRMALQRCLWWLSLWLGLVCFYSNWNDLHCCSTFSMSLNLALGY